ncbi:deleted in malignant brain tumors 1 protein-like [Ostrea edulis]|uniref:deleted in malignant brain tumors 1 protein-like n=1 Tax=Ostrea edulis TaxID=37623 RepID=UPI002095403C|nr:deleted in malignant brain tumors 1 protein-like [Ostrea edulis]
METEGRVELLHDGKWGTVCDDDFDTSDGDVICRMLGYKGAIRVFGTAHFSNGYGPIWQDNLHCNGDEADIGDCASNGWGNTDCGHGEDAGVSCDPNDFQIGYFSQRATVGNPCILTSTPCRNGGTCIAGAKYGYICKCPVGFGGTYCQSGFVRTTPKHTCQNNTCQNGGTCYQTRPQDDYHCSCPSGYTGNLCETDKNTESITSVGCLDDAWNITVYLPPLLQKYPDFNPKECYIGFDNANCTGQLNGSYLYFGQDYSQCKTKEMNLTEGVEYSNEIICAHHDPLYHFIIREIQLRTNLLCKFFSFSSLTTKERLVHLQFFSNPSLSRLTNFNTSQVGDNVYVRAYSDITNSALRMRLSHCYVTPTIITDPKMRYFIIQNGCVIDPNAVIFYQAVHETRFSFQYFEFATSRDPIHLYCNATFCPINDHSPTCRPTCHSHVIRRSDGGNVNDDIGYNDEEDFEVDLPDNQAPNVQSEHDTSVTSVTIISVVFGVFILALLTVAVVIKIRPKENVLKR